MNQPLARLQVCLLFFLLVTASTVTAFLSGCQAPLAQISAAGTQARVVTLGELAKSLPAHPTHVVFDVDDTALFTSAGFQWGTHTSVNVEPVHNGAFGEEVLLNSEF